MVSSAALSMVSVAWIPATIPSAVLGLVVNLTEDEKKLEFNSAVEAAIKRTREQMTSPSKQAILDELDQLEIEPNSLGELIKKAGKQKLIKLNTAQKRMLRKFLLYLIVTLKSK